MADVRRMKAETLLELGEEVEVRVSSPNGLEQENKEGNEILIPVPTWTRSGWLIKSGTNAEHSAGCQKEKWTGAESVYMIKSLVKYTNWNTEQNLDASRRSYQWTDGRKQRINLVLKWFVQTCQDACSIIYVKQPVMDWCPICGKISWCQLQMHSLLHRAS